MERRIERIVGSSDNMTIWIPDSQSWDQKQKSAKLEKNQNFSAHALQHLNFQSAAESCFLITWQRTWTPWTRIEAIFSALGLGLSRMASLTHKSMWIDGPMQWTHHWQFSYSGRSDHASHPGNLPFLTHLMFQLLVGQSVENQVRCPQHKEAVPNTSEVARSFELTHVLVLPCH